jgi:membrane protein involved in colicin uptake
LNFGSDDNSLGKPESVYDRARMQGEKAEEDLRRIQGEAAKAEAQKWAGLFEFLNKIFSTMAGAMGSPSIGGTATAATATG